MGVYKKKDIELIVNSFVNVVGDGLKNDSKVKIEGLGTFSTYFKNIHSLNNAKCDNVAKCISFKPSKRLKQ